MTETSEELTDEQMSVIAIIRMCTSAISLVASITVIVVISRSEQRFSTTQNRLLLGLSISDIISSFANSFASLPMPKGTPNAWISLGNTTTCNIQGFLLQFGLLTTPHYNAALCIFFLLKVRYNMSTEKIVSQVEPFFHAIPISFALITGVYSQIKEYVSPALSICYISDFPKGCNADADVPCERGEGLFQDWFLRACIFIFLMHPFVIFGTMITVYVTVRQQETRMAMYGVGSLNLGTSQSNTSIRIRSRYIKTVMYRGLAYSGAWLLTFGPALAEIIKSYALGIIISYCDSLVISIFFPLQGFFNFLVFIYPKVNTARRENPQSSSCEIFFIALNPNSSPTPRWRHNSMIVRDQEACTPQNGND